MNTTLTEIVFILDKSGSMSGLEKDTIGGYNSFLEKQKQTEGEALVSTVLFSDRNTVLHDRIPIGSIKPLTDNDYMAGGCTALLDAIGEAGKLGIRADRAVRYECDDVGTALNFETVGVAMCCIREGKTLKADWSEAIVDYQKKGRKKRK